MDGQLMVEEKVDDYAIGLLACDTYNRVIGIRAVNGWRKKQRENKEINKESNKERKLISLLGFSLMGLQSAPSPLARHARPPASATESKLIAQSDK